MFVVTIGGVGRSVTCRKQKQEASGLHESSCWAEMSLQNRWRKGRSKMRRFFVTKPRVTTSSTWLLFLSYANYSNLHSQDVQDCYDNISRFCRWGRLHLGARDCRGEIEGLSHVFWIKAGPFWPCNFWEGFLTNSPEMPHVDQSWTIHWFYSVVKECERIFSTSAYGNPSPKRQTFWCRGESLSATMRFL